MTENGDPRNLKSSATTTALLAACAFGMFSGVGILVAAGFAGLALLTADMVFRKPPGRRDFDEDFPEVSESPVEEPSSQWREAIEESRGKGRGR